MLRSLSALAIILALSQTAGAQEQVAKIVAPYVNDTTQIVVHVSVEKLNLKKYFDTIVSVTKDLAPAKELAELDEAKKAAIAHQAKLLKAGIKDIYAVVNFGDLANPKPPSVFLIAPFSPGADLNEYVQLLGQVPNVMTKLENNVFVAAYGTVALPAPGKRPEFAEGMIALKNLDTKIIVALSADLRKFAEDKLAPIAQAMGVGDITVLTKGLRWLGIGYDTSAPAQEIVLQGKDAQSAKELLAFTDTGVKILGKMLQGAVPADVLNKVFAFKQQNDRVTLRIDEKAVKDMLQAAAPTLRQASATSSSMNNLKQIGLAMHMYHDVAGKLPAQANYNKDGKALLSWRVHILPFIEQDNLYKQFKLDEPWDSPNNKMLIEKIPAIYVSPLSKVGKEGKTTYLGTNGKGAMFDDKQGTRLTDVTDGLSNTILVVEANDKKAVYWTKPEDFPIDAKDPLGGLVNEQLKGFLTTFADGSVHLIHATIPPATLRALFTRNGGEDVNIDDFDK